MTHGTSQPAGGAGHTTGTAISADEVLEQEKADVEKAFEQVFDQRYRAYLDGSYADFVKGNCSYYHKYVAENYSYICSQDYPCPDRPGYALSISGGGIRSASFAIGVVQALANRGFVRDGEPTIYDKLSYLSTVSGGGYTGSALTWYRKVFGVFPFGDVTSFAGSKSASSPDGQSADRSGVQELQSNNILSYIRQHGKYLIPTELGFSSLLATGLASILHSCLAYMLAMALLLLLVFGALAVPGVSELLLGHLDEAAKEMVCVPDPQLAPDSSGLAPCDQTTADGDARGQGGNFLSEDISIVRLGFLKLSLVLSLFCLSAYALLGLGYAVTSYFTNWFSSLYAYRIAVQRGLGLLLKLVGASLVLAALPLLAQFLVGTALERSDRIFMSSASFSSFLAIVLAIMRFRQQTRGGETASSVPQAVFSALIVVAFIVVLLALSFILAEYLYTAGWLWIAVFSVATVVAVWLVDINQLSLHKLYRDRLMETFMSATVAQEAALVTRGGKANDQTLASLADLPHWAPYQLINCNVILDNSRVPRYSGRLGDSFLLSAGYCGSDATGYVKTENLGNGRMTLATAMAISGAAANPHAGVGGEGRSTDTLVSYLMTICGLRLGYWVRNPNPRFGKKLRRPNYLVPGINSLLGIGHKETEPFVELSDGGHFDNSGLYELVRRRMPVIVLADGSADQASCFNDLGNALERVRVDFGVSIRFRDGDYDLAGMLPGSQSAATQGRQLYDQRYNLATRGYAIADIVYPDLPTQGDPAGDDEDGAEKGRGAFVGRLVYIKSVLTRNLPGDIYAYKAAHDSFPDQPTSDQFFDERQFESYRELGYQVTRQFLEDKRAMAMLP